MTQGQVIQNSQPMINKYLQKKSMTPKETHEDPVKIFAEDLSSITTKKKWDVEVKQNRVNTKNDPRSCHPKFSTNDKQVSATKSMTPKEIHEDMAKILAEDLSSITTKKKWDVEIKQNRVNTKDDQGQVIQSSQPMINKYLQQKCMTPK